MFTERKIIYKMKYANLIIKNKDRTSESFDY